ncbi:hypothetical protein LWI29_027151 [Acer saccharum]|uniref:Protein FAR1-RELATED SEQUENCE n=1 Tax=Acer saccharum TaxID=4024 RepID=A0AA39SP18_ACESA|nr:hypothetical protein LWI29_027151 [Acer saccharum]
MRLAELEDDYCCKKGVSRLKIPSGILSHGVQVYTNKMFKFFQTELMGCIGVRMKEVSVDRELHIYEAIEEGKQRVFEVQYNSLTLNVSCCCKLFKSMGILCRHALKVFDFNNLTSIPSKYILKRWTKDAKRGISATCDRLASSGSNEKSIHSLRLSELMHAGNNLYSIASLTESGTKIVKEKIAELMKLLEQDKETITALECLKKTDEQPSIDAVGNEVPILNPPVVRTKGLTNARLKSNLEKRKRKVTKAAAGNTLNRRSALMEAEPAAGEEGKDVSRHRLNLVVPLVVTTHSSSSAAAG